MTGKAKKGEGKILAAKILGSEKAFDKFKEIIEAQKGHIDGIKIAKFKKDFFMKKTGVIKEIDNKKITALARIAGCPMDKSAGLYLYRHVGDRLEKGDKIITVYAESETRLKEASGLFISQKPIKF
jgi:thymidine phosphorylase